MSIGGADFYGIMQRSLDVRSAAGAARTANAGNGEGNNEKLREVAEDFEALFVEQMLSSMRNTLNTEDDLFYGGMAEEYFQDMLYQEYAKVMAKRGDFGIAEVIYDQFRQ